MNLNCFTRLMNVFFTYLCLLPRTWKSQGLSFFSFLNVLRIDLTQENYKGQRAKLENWECSYFQTRLRKNEWTNMDFVLLALPNKIETIYCISRFVES